MFRFRDGDGRPMTFVGIVTPIVLLEFNLSAAQGGTRYWQSGWHGDVTFNSRVYLKDNPVASMDFPTTENTLTEESWTLDLLDEDQDWYDRIKPFQASAWCQAWAIVWNNDMFSANRMHRATGFSPEMEPTGERNLITRLNWSNEMRNPTHELGFLMAESTFNSYDPEDNAGAYANKSLELGWGSLDGSRRGE